MTFTEVSWAAQTNVPLLAILQLLPLAFMALMLVPGLRRAAFPLSAAGSVLELLLAIRLYLLFEPGSSAMQFAERLALAGPLGYHAAADGITVLFVLLNALLTLLVVLYSRARDLDALYRLLALVFAVEALLMSLLVTVDLLWFVLVSALQLVPVGYLVWRWAGSPEKDLVLTRFYQFMGIGLLLLLAGALMLGWNHADAGGRGWSFDLFELAAVPVPPQVGSVIFFLLFYGLAIRIPVFPLHGWLPMLAEHGSIAVAPVFLLGLKTGVYGLLRFVFPLLPDAVLEWHRYVVAFAVVGIFYAALLAVLQVNLRRLLAFAVVSHSGLLIIGLFSLGELSFEGATMLSLNFGLAISGLLFMIGLIYKRTRTMLVSRLGGLLDPLPLLGVAFLVAGLAIVGMPGTPGFDAAHLVMKEAMHRFGALVTIAAALGNVVAAGFLLLAFQRAFLSPPPASRAEAVPPASALEKLTALLVIAVLLGTGFYFEPWLVLVESATEALGTLYATPGAR